jgi:hypothetical protein
MDMTKLIVAFRNFEKAPKKVSRGVNSSDKMVDVPNTGHGMVLTGNKKDLVMVT